MSSLPLAVQNQYAQQAIAQGNAQDAAQTPQGVQLPQGLQQQSTMPQLPQSGAPQQVNGPPPPTAGGRVKNLLSNFFYGAGQGLLKEAGLPTDYEKAQQQKVNDQRQQQLNQAGQETQSLIQQRQQQAVMQQQQNQLVPLPAPVANELGITHVPMSQFGSTMQSYAQYVASGRGQGSGLLTLTPEESAAIPGTKPGDSYGIKQLPAIKAAVQAYNQIHNPATFVANGPGGGTGTFDKRTGTYSQLTGPGTSGSYVGGIARSVAGANARAAVTPYATFDDADNPTVVSNLQALRQGAAKATFGDVKNVASDMVGVKQYQSILDNKITPNLRVLEDPQQRAIIAHTLSEADKNPGALQSLVTSSLQGGLSPQGAQLVAGIMQGREFGGVARKYGGNMNGTEGLMNRIMANQASPLNAGAVNTELIKNDRDFTDKALSKVSGLMSHNAGGASASVPSTSTQSAPNFGFVPRKP